MRSTLDAQQLLDLACLPTPYSLTCKRCLHLCSSLPHIYQAKRHACCGEEAHRKNVQAADEVVADVQMRERGQLAHALQAMHHVAAKDQVAQRGRRYKLLGGFFLLYLVYA